MSLQRRVYDILEARDPGDLVTRLVHAAIYGLIIANIFVLILETVQPVHDAVPLFFRWFERISVAAFSAEYLLRIWSCTIDPRYGGAFGRLRFGATPLAVVDLLAVLPFYLPFLGLDLRFVRSLRLFRMFRILKLGRYSVGLQTLGRALQSKKEELLLILFVLGVLLIMASSLMYFAEHSAQPDKFSSIPTAMWWSVVTLTTVGYGDVYPVTMLGKVVGGFVAVLGIGMFALPTAVIGAAFLQEIEGRRKAQACPHCGKQIGDNGERGAQTRA